MLSRMWTIRVFFLIFLTITILPLAGQETASHRIVLPVVGNAAGANGTFFKSTVTLLDTKYRNGTGAPSIQRVRVDFYPQGGSADLSAPVFFEVTGFISHWANFLQDFYTVPRSGLGAVVFTAVDANGNEQTDGRLFAVSRIYTAQASTAGCPTPGGEVSQSLESLPFDDLASLTERGWINGLRHDARFRTNVGIVNHSDSPQAFTITLYPFTGGDPSSYEVSVPARGMIHNPIPAGDYGPSLLVDVQAKAAGFFFSAYGSTVDNATGDGWTFRATH